MSRYRKVETALWSDERFRELSSPPPNAKTVWLFLLTGRFTTLFPGLIVSSAETIAAELGWSKAGFLEVFGELESRGMARADWASGVVLLPKALFDSMGEPRATSKPESPNVLKKWGGAWQEVPECELAREYLRTLGSFAEALGEGFAKAFREAFAKGLAKASRHPSPHPSPNQETGDRISTAPVPDPDQGPTPLSGASGPGLPGDLVGPAAEPEAAPVSRTAAPAASPPAHPPGALGALCERFIRLVNEARARVAAARGIADVRPLPAIIATSSTHLRELRERLEHAADPAGDMEHVIAIAEAEATEDGEKLKWLGWSLARENAWSVKLAASLAPGKRKPAKARDIRTGPADAPEGHRYESFVMDGSEAFKR